ncbi:hypothetical protein IC762_22445 [Bradyrhizobium genosp. L]|uniref:hypothetical protein n=1 Tax=Bradyrhizobium genosp. L TaxID=83637 RepID=UPI0018A3227A|nr:hypothetical protein [Bradyrhizobium genosp. L]QPF82508.1 hypothetical protein IC762_22445 [Bradyrhizobium genosp. L]
MSMVTRLSVLLLSAAAIASCGVAAKAQSAEEWAQVIAMDRKLVQSGASPELIQIDMTIAKMIPEGQAIVASHDQAKARQWSQKFHALMARKDQISRKYLAEHPFKYAGPKADPCLSPMGKNTCAPPPTPQPRRMCSINYGSTVGLIPCD